jgi:hypothetical protein
MRHQPKSELQVDRNLVLCLPRLTVLVSIEADRPGAWFPGPLGPYHAWFPGIGLSHVKHLMSCLNNLLKASFTR